MKGAKLQEHAKTAEVYYSIAAWWIGRQVVGEE